jgi:hypothetical protein
MLRGHLGSPTGRAHARRRRGALLTEVVIAAAILGLMLVNLLTLFRTGVRQTHGVRSRVVARCLADWAMSQARAFVASGLAAPEDQVSLTQDVKTMFGETAAQLQQLQVVRSVSAGGVDERLFTITVRVRWMDPGITTLREVALVALERSET